MAAPLKAAAAGLTKLCLPMFGFIPLHLSGLAGLLGAGQGLAVEQDTERCDRRRAWLGSPFRSLSKGSLLRAPALKPEGPADSLFLPEQVFDLDLSGSARSVCCCKRIFSGLVKPRKTYNSSRKCRGYTNPVILVLWRFCKGLSGQLGMAASDSNQME